MSKIVYSEFCPQQEMHLCEDASGDFVLVTSPHFDRSKDAIIHEHRRGTVQTAEELLKFLGEESIS